MRIMVMGAGAVGGYFGAKLAAAGHELHFIARGKHLDALCRHGLRVNSPGGHVIVRNASFSADPGASGAIDVVLFCVKSYDSESAANLLQPVVGPDTIILSLQNGVDNAGKLADRFGDRRVLAGVVYVGAQVAAPGLIEHSAGGKIVFGPRKGGDNGAAAKVEQILGVAGIPYEQSLEIEAVQWRKLLWNAPFCAISCLTHATVRDIVESDVLTELAVNCMEEVKQAAAVRGVKLSTELFAETLAFSKTLGPFKPSMLQDFDAGKPLEYEAFNGIVVKLLASVSRDAPVNRVFYGALKYLDDKIREEAARSTDA
jgi:2-dehydropantoate 2-reductase